MQTYAWFGIMLLQIAAFRTKSSLTKYYKEDKKHQGVCLQGRKLHYDPSKAS